MPNEFTIIVATDEAGGIGKENRLCWKNKEDLTFFRKITTTTKDSNKINAIIMGRKTWDSLSVAPLLNRLNIVISRTKKNDSFVQPHTQFVNSIESAFEYCESPEQHIESIFIIGGEQIYNYCLASNRLNKVYWTTISGEFNCDRFFRPPLEFFDMFTRTNIELNRTIYIRNNVKM